MHAMFPTHSRLSLSLECSGEISRNPSRYKIEQLPRNYADGGGVALVYRRCFKVKKDVKTIHRSFELINIHITSACNHNLRLVVIYRAPPSLENGFTVRMFLEEFSSFLEGLV